MSEGAFDFVGPQVQEAPLPRGPGVAARMFSLAMLTAIGAAIAFAGHTAYHAVRDCYVAPAILSPDSDVVVASKVKLAELIDERARAADDLASIDANVTADDVGVERLEGLERKLNNAVHWTSEVVSAKALAGGATLRSLAQQKEVMEGMLASQRELTQKARTDVEAGIISRDDYARETQTLDQLQISILNNDRATLDAQAALRETQLAQLAVQRPNEAPLTPELLAREEEAIRVELERTRLESDARAKRADHIALSDRIAKLDALTNQLKSRPLYRAAERSLDVAFVPYSQSNGVDAGASVFACVWGLFFCKQVGTIAEIVPGEIVSPDPWGVATRGQYAVLNLWSPEAARLKTLRVRTTGSVNNQSIVASSGNAAN